VFKGREAKLNRAIFQSLAAKGPQTIYDIHKDVRTFRGLKRTHYANVNKRVRSLEKLCYLRIVNAQTTQAGFKAAIYELTNRAYLALILSAISIDDLLNRLGDRAALQILAVLAESTSKTNA